MPVTVTEVSGHSTLVAWAVLSFTTGSDVHAILKGQVYFSTGASLLFGALVSHWILRTSSCTWTLVAVAVVAGGAYVFGQPEQTALAAARDAGTYVNLSSVARPLPLEFAAMTEDSDEGFRREKFLYGIRARYRMAYGYWQFAVRINFI